VTREKDRRKEDSMGKEEIIRGERKGVREGDELPHAKRGNSNDVVRVPNAGEGERRRELARVP